LPFFCILCSLCNKKGTNVINFSFGKGRKTLYLYKPKGALPRHDYEDGISTKNLVLNILWCTRVGNYIKKGGEHSAGYGLIERF